MRSRPPSRGKPELRPVIAEVLRTCVQSPSLLLRVEQILEQDANSNSEKGYAATSARSEVAKRSYRLILGDGELMIQAVLRQDLHVFIESQSIGVGVLIELRKYKIARANRTNGQGQVIYIGIEDLEVVGATIVQPPAVDLGLEGGFIREEGNDQRAVTLKRKWEDQSGGYGRQRRNTLADETMLSSQESGEFETAPIDINATAQRRRVLKELNHINGRAIAKRDDISLGKRRKFLVQKDADAIQATQADQVVPQPCSKQDLNRPDAATAQTQHLAVPSLHDLASLINPTSPLPSRNYLCSIFAVISWVSTSTIQKPHSPFPSKRHIKIHDPSISSRHAGITLAVFVDAKGFFPTIGTVALFRGLTMQKWGGEVILNAYATLKDREEKWCEDDPEQLRRLGHDVEKMQTWWKDRKIKQGRHPAHGRLKAA